MLEELAGSKIEPAQRLLPQRQHPLMREPFQVMHRWPVRTVLRVVADVDEALLLELVIGLAAWKRLEKDEFRILRIELDREVNGVANALLGIAGQSEAEESRGLEPDVLGCPDRLAYLILGDALLDELEDAVVAALDPEAHVAQAHLLERGQDLLAHHVRAQAVGDLEMQPVRLLL